MAPKEKDHYDQLVEALRNLRKANEAEIKLRIAEVVDAHEDAWFDLLMNGTNGASDESLARLNLERTYEQGPGILG